MTDTASAGQARRAAAPAPGVGALNLKSESGLRRAAPGDARAAAGLPGTGSGTVLSQPGCCSDCTALPVSKA